MNEQVQMKTEIAEGTKQLCRLVLANKNLERAISRGENSMKLACDLYTPCPWDFLNLFLILSWETPPKCHMIHLIFLSSFIMWGSSLAYNGNSKIQAPCLWNTTLKGRISTHFLVHGPPRAANIPHSSRSDGLNWRKCLNMGILLGQGASSVFIRAEVSECAHILRWCRGGKLNSGLLVKCT